MGLKGKITAKGIEGMFFRKYESAADPVTSELMMKIESEQGEEDHVWLSQTPGLKERGDGGLRVGKLIETDYKIKNRVFDAAVGIPRWWYDHDKTGQIRAKINEFAVRAANHPLELLLDLIADGASATCYDGQYFFDTDHSEGKSGVQSNSLSKTIASDEPTVGEVETAILEATQALVGFKGDDGEPFNENAKEFRIVAGASMLTKISSALRSQVIIDGSTSRSNSIVGIGADGFTFKPFISPRLNWTKKFSIFRADSYAKPFIFQDVDPLETDVLAEGSDHYTKEDEVLLKIRAVRGAGYGFWQYGVLTTMAKG